MKPSDVGKWVPEPAVNEVPLRVLDPVGAPVFVAIMVAVDEVFGSTPVTVTRPEPFMVTMPPFVAVPDHV